METQSKNTSTMSEVCACVGRAGIEVAAERMMRLQLSWAAAWGSATGDVTNTSESDWDTWANVKCGHPLLTHYQNVFDVVFVRVWRHSMTNACLRWESPMTLSWHTGTQLPNSFTSRGGRSRHTSWSQGLQIQLGRGNMLEVEHTWLILSSL